MTHSIFMTWKEMQAKLKDESASMPPGWVRNHEFFTLIDWLSTHIGSNKFKWDSQWIPDARSEYGGVWLYKFDFLNKSDAVHFKLRWGGRS